MISETEIDDVDVLCIFPYASQEIVGFEVAVNIVTAVNVFNSRELFGVNKMTKERKGMIHTS